MEERQLWNYKTEEIAKGYVQNPEGYECILCGQTYQKGKIYPVKEQLYDAYGAVQQHVLTEHNCSADYLLGKEAGLTGISEVQQQLLRLMSQGREDKAIAKELGIAESTVRNHRFKLREKQKQAKLYLAMMQSLEEKMNRKIEVSDQGVLEEIHATAKMVDARFIATDQEREKTLKTYLDDQGRLKQFPAREKKKIIVLKEIMKRFHKGKDYEEKEVNEILKDIFSDYPTIRRALIEYGFMERSEDCTVYRVKE